MGLLIIFVWKKLQKKGGNNFKKKLGKRENFLPTGGGGRGVGVHNIKQLLFLVLHFHQPYLGTAIRRLRLAIDQVISG